MDDNDPAIQQIFWKRWETTRNASQERVPEPGLSLTFNPFLTESMSGVDLPLLAELSKEMLQNAGIEQCFHSNTISAGNMEKVL